MATLSGVTRTNTGAALASATVNVFDASNNTLVATGTSDASGNFAITTSTTGPFYIVAFKSGTTFVAGTSKRDLTAVAASGAATVQYLWTGTPTTSGVIVSAKMNSTNTAASCRMVVSTNASLTSPVYSAAVAPDTTFRIAKLSITGLAANTSYFYGIEVDGTVDTTTIGKFRTVQSASAHSFTIALGSCSDNLGDQTFTAINALSPKPLFLLHMGDFHYTDTNSTLESDYQTNYDNTFSRTTRHIPHREIPTVYMWDDHDFGPNDSTGRDASNNVNTYRAASIAAFRRRVPVTTAATGATDSVYYSFVIGRVRFVITDCRSDRTANSATDNSSKTMLGATQKTWFKAEITAAKAAGQFVAWMTSVPWVGAASANADNWLGYTTERTELADHIKAEAMTGKVCILSGDMHALAIHSGADYATGGGGAIPVFHAGPFASPVSIKGGSYDIGTYPTGTGTTAFQYGTMEVVDNGTSMTINWKGYTSDNTQRISHSFTPFTAATAPATMAAPTATGGDGTATVTMTAPADGGSAITGYTVTSIPAGGVDSNAGTTGLVHTMTGLTNGTAYTFTARATNAVGTSAASPASNSVTPVASAAKFEATGGTVTTDATHKYWTFTSNDTLNVTAAGNVEYLVVAGGGGGSRGGSSAGGGGGAGGLRTGTINIAATQAITVGLGGVGGSASSSPVSQGGLGGASSIGSLITTVGGGFGGASTFAASTGGSGGGAGSGDGLQTGAAGTGGEGSQGGNGVGLNSDTTVRRAGGGGGGAGAVGSNGAAGVGGAGGAGLTVFGRTVAGGGGGSGVDGQGAGAAGGGSGSNATSTSATANTGSGGGGNTNNGTAGSGGSGIVVIRRPL